MKRKTTYLRVTTVPESISILLNGQPEFLKANNFDVRLSASGKCPEHLSQFPFLHLPMTRRISPAKDLLSICKLTKYLRRENIQIIHSHTPKAGLIAMISGYIAGTPIRLHTIAGLPQDYASFWIKLIFNLTEYITYSCAHKIYFNSSSQLNSQAKKFPLSSIKFDVIHNGTSNGIDIEKFSAIKNNAELKSRLGINDNKFIWLFVGRIHRHKGIIELLEAFNKFDLEMPGKSELYIVGSLDKSRTDLNDEWLESIQKTNRSVHFTGFQNNISDWLNASDCLIFPSYREGFPNVPLQAASVGKPIIASNINGCNEIITHGKNGLLVPVRQIEPIIDAMKEIFHNNDVRKSMGEWSMRNIPKKYDRNIFHRKLFHEYQTLLTDKGLPKKL